MLSKCANPACGAAFHYLHDGKLFQVDVQAGEGWQRSGPQLISGRKPLHKVEYFWLCGPCSAALTLAYERGKGVITVPRAPDSERRAEAS